MTDANEARLAALERRVAELEAYKDRIEGLNFQFIIVELHRKLKRQAEFVRSAIKGLKHHKDLFEVHGDMIDLINEQIRRLDEAYYRVFPEREAQDARVTKQLLRLKLLKDSDSKD